MAYQVLARKWRPQNFSSLVGQESIVTALRNALQEGRIAQAYLFSGIRGVGKTTAARVLAKALNCERGPAADPCNECTSCIEITRGSDLDVIEVDAATYSKVEQVRELTESLKYGPARDRYKVVVLDEIHRLSRQAFDALLKIVEEPPRHLVFIFATTEIDAVPATILSRCQEFNFRRVPSHNLAAYLRTITAAEGIQASDTALRLIARAGEGSVRDSVALLDQLATFGSGSIADEDTVRLLGGLDTALFQTLLAGILAGDAQAVAAAVRRVEEEGWDPRHVYGQFLAFARDALHLAMGGSPEQVDLPIEEAQILAATAKASGYENLLRLLNQLLTSENIVRRSDTGALAVEIAWLRAAELPKLIRVEEILAGTWQPGAAPAPASRPAAPAPRPASAPATIATMPPRSAAPDPAPRAATPPPRPAPQPEPPSVLPAKPAPSRSSDPLTAFKEEAAKRKPNLGGFLDAAEDIRFEDGRVTILIPSGDSYLRTRLEANRAILEEAAAAVWGPGTRLEARESRPAPQAASAEAKPARAPSVEPAVQAVLEIFQGSRVEVVEEHGNYTED
ncbi:MAG: DNA polymerase III subunit gamma/tau [Acidobacteria bacterium]|nr:DNA polymerase III subunit gamma/tau [Acidobacteriota bacterium]